MSRSNGSEQQNGTQPGETSPVAFEESLEQLDAIVAQLEDGQLALDDALRLFERGVQLARACQQMLDTAELRVQKLRIPEGGQALGEDEEFILETFEIDEN